MERKRKIHGCSLLLTVLLAGELILLADAVTAWLDIRIEMVTFLAAFLIVTGLIHICKSLTNRKKAVLCAGIILVSGVFGFASYAVWLATCRSAVYGTPDNGKGNLYANRNIMVIVPHQDDEANLLSGILEEYADYGSEIRAVYITNGDAGGIPETRLQEAISYCEFVGIPKENVIFLGYGDQWDSEYGHLYNAPEGEALQSRFGRTETYGLDTHPAYREGRAYTSENLMADLESVILQYRPDTIFAIDYDSHIDHRAGMLWFERVMGKICREQEDYAPVVLKGYAYAAAWYAEEDFYDSVNVRSTRNVFGAPHWQEPEVYRWQDRVRLPVQGETLSHSLIGSRAYESLTKFSSQEASFRAVQIVNGDRVFWQRRTDSLSAKAEISVSSGNSSLLNDFLLIDNKNLKEQDYPYDSVWIPEQEDHEKTIRIQLQMPSEISAVVLYDHPDENRNVLDAVIRFDDGTEIASGPLDVTGAATVIPAEKSGVQWVEIALTDTAGEFAGLTEVELLPKSSQKMGAFLKVMDREENFVYDFCTMEENTEFQLFTAEIENFRQEDCRVECSTKTCKAAMTEGKLRVACPKGETCVVKVTHIPSGSADSIRVSCMGAGEYHLLRWGQQAEAFAVFRTRRMAVCRTARVLWKRLAGP